MPTTPTFARVSLDQFEQLLKRFPFTRQINAVHMHHSWRPRHEHFKGHETIVAMWRHHTQRNGWRDIAQHLTIDPEGQLWLGRNWNLPPASAAGHNGNAAFGPFMFEMVGDFDVGQDRFDGAQKQAAVEVVALLQSRFALQPESLRLHSMMSAKSCPGSAIDFAALQADVRTARARRHAAARGGDGAERAAAEPFPDERGLAVAQALRSLQRVPEVGAEPADAESSHDEREAPALDAAVRQDVAAPRDSALGAAALAALRPHLINLTMGRLSTTGELASTPADVDAIFEQHLPAAVARAKAGGRRLPVLFFAHGGLVSESHGLQGAHRQIDWWRRNGIYPIYFIWETGLCETVAQLLGRAAGRSRALTRDLFDVTTDPLIEAAARALQGPRLWGGMKSAAEHAVDAPTAGDPVGGGAGYAARALRRFCDQHAADVELHAVGHSAGSIFHSHFLPAARALGVPTFASAHFLAPAIRCDEFKQRLLPQIGADKAVERLSVFTMQRDHERADDCARVYRKSLLYLIHHALEDPPRTPILGLEESLRADAELKRLFGLDGAAAAGDVVWSPSPGDSGRSASRACRHGDFDDDAATMNSVARRVLGRADADPVVEFPVRRDGDDRAREWSDEVDWPPAFDKAPAFDRPPPAPPPAWLPAPTPARPPAPTSASAPAAAAGRRRALCVGIDAYPRAEHRLAGCVNDARRWQQLLHGHGFETQLLLDGQATRVGLEDALRALIDGSRAGDVLVFQYAGHGTQVPDIDGDEADGNDEALCPVDFADGALFIDDDVARLFAALGDGVNLTCLMDCCHSGTNTRVAAARQPPLPPGARARFVRATSALIDAHRTYRARLPAPSRDLTRAAPAMRDVKFSACRDHEVAWESGGSGEFTLRSMQVLAGGLDGLGNERFVQRVVAAFGNGARQQPMLDCADGVGRRGLLQPWAGHGAEPSAGDAAGRAAASGVPQALNLMAQAMQALTVQ